MAKKAIAGGKVQCNGARSKPGKELVPGMIISLRQGFDTRTVVVKALSEQRREAPQARLLYEETEASIKQREELAVQRKAQPKPWPTPGKPNKKQRRLITRFKQKPPVGS